MTDKHRRFYESGPLWSIIEDPSRTIPVLAWHKHGVVPARADIKKALIRARALGVELFGEDFALRFVVLEEHFVIHCIPLTPVLQNDEE